jgi:hypothetical protein
MSDKQACFPKTEGKKMNQVDNIGPNPYGFKAESTLPPERGIMIVSVQSYNVINSRTIC